MVGLTARWVHPQSLFSQTACHPLIFLWIHLTLILTRLQQLFSFQKQLIGLSRSNLSIIWLTANRLVKIDHFLVNLTLFDSELHVYPVVLRVSDDQLFQIWDCIILWVLYWYNLEKNCKFVGWIYLKAPLTILQRLRLSIELILNPRHAL